MRKVDPVKHEQKRQEILDAAQRCFVREGIKGASIAKLCAEASISPGHLYHYFESKEAILGAICQRVLERVTVHFSETMEQDDPIAAIQAYLAAVQTQYDHSRYRLVLDLLAEAERNPALAQVLGCHSVAMCELLAGWLQRGQDRGMVDASLDTKEAARVIVGLIDGFKIMHVRDPLLPREASLKMVELVIIRFLSPSRAA